MDLKIHNYYILPTTTYYDNMKEIETSGGRKVTVQLDDEDYEKVMRLIVPKIYFLINHTKKDHADGPHSLYVFPKGYNTTRKNLTSFLFGLNRGKKVKGAALVLRMFPFDLE